MDATVAERMKDFSNTSLGREDNAQRIFVATYVSAPVGLLSRILFALRRFSNRDVLPPYARRHSWTIGVVTDSRSMPRQPVALRARFLPFSDGTYAGPHVGHKGPWDPTSSIAWTRNVSSWMERGRVRILIIYILGIS